MAEPVIHRLPTRDTAPPRTRLGRWFFHGGVPGEEREHGETHPWYMVIWLTGVDYFSTLGYQPGIALVAAGVLSPVATLILVVVTLLGALPVYAQVAGRSYAGQGSIAMLENLLPGWKGKVFVLVLLGFAGTDFVITMTLSAADAAQHAVHNPYLHPYLGEARFGVTIFLLTLLAIVFLMGFREAIVLAASVAIPFLLLNLIVLARGLLEIAWHPEFLAHWRAGLALHGDWTMMVLASAIVFPKLALGLSGFETGTLVMTEVQGEEGDERRRVPEGRIRATRKLLAAAALIMSVMLVLSSFVTTLLVSRQEVMPGGRASGRAIAYLAHHLLGEGFGTVYDLSTIVILWFAGASAMAGLLSIIPRYLPRFGMAPRWASYRRPLVFVLFTIDVIVTVVFKAGVEAQGGAYATGVLVLMVSASVAVALALGRESHIGRKILPGTLLLSFLFWVVTAVLGFTLVDNVIERPDGIIIGSCFILAVLVFSGVSRYFRATELRVAEFTFVDKDSQDLWQQLTDKKFNLVPLSEQSPAARAAKAYTIRRNYQIGAPLTFIHVYLLDNRSEFLAPLRVKVTPEKQDYVIEVWGATAIANTIAYISELMDPIAIFLELTGENLMSQSFRYILWGEGEVGLLVYTILLHYWEWTPPGDVRPRIYLMSD